MMQVSDPNAQSALPTTQESISSNGGGGVSEGFLNSKLSSVIIKRIYFNMQSKKECMVQTHRENILVESFPRQLGFSLERRAQEG